MPTAKKEVEKVYSILKNRPPEEEKYLFAYNRWITLDSKSYMYFRFLDFNKREGKDLIFIQFDENYNPVLRIEGNRFKIKGRSILIQNGKIIDLSDIFSFNYRRFKTFDFPVAVDIKNLKTCKG